MNARRILLGLSFAIVIALAAPAARSADPPDAPEMRSVALAFSKAVHAGDVAAAKTMAVGNAKNMETLALVSKAWKTLDAVFAAIQKAQPEALEELNQMKQSIGMAEDLDQQAAKAVITVDGEVATLSDPPATPPAAPRPGARQAKRDFMPDDYGEPLMLRKVDGKWKVDLDATFHAKMLDTEKGIASWREMHEQGEKMLAAIKAGEFKIPHRPATRPAQP